VVFGPDMRHFKEPAAALLAAGAARQLKSEHELAGTLAEILQDPEKARRMGQAGKKVCEENRGASRRLVGLVQKMLLIRELKDGSRDQRIESVPSSPSSQELFGRFRSEIKDPRHER
jgi:hypothetical protein